MQRKNRSFQSVSVFALVILAVAFGAAPARAETFGESISVTEVEIPVTVLRDNEPVRGLTRDDFVVTDDGAPREIVGFRVVDLAGGPTGEDRSAAAPDATGPEETEGRRILVLVDLAFSKPHHLSRALDGIERMVSAQLHPADRVAVAYLAPSGAHLVLGFSRDHEAVGAALAGVQALVESRPAAWRENLGRVTKAEATQRRQTRAGVLSDQFGPSGSIAILAGIETGDGPTLALPYGPGRALAGAVFDDSGENQDPVTASVARTDPFQIGVDLAAASYTSAIRSQALEIRRLLTLLRGVPSPKQVLFLSEGFGHQALRSFDSAERASILGALDDVSEALRRAGWTLHAVDVSGIPDAFSGEGFTGDSLLRLAKQTGGQIYENYNRIELATAKLARRTSVTYVLTIRSGELPADGRQHRLGVHLRQDIPGTQVLHRTGYYDPKPLGERSRLERQLDIVDLALGQDEIHQMEAHVLARSLPPSDGIADVPFVIELPASELAQGLTLPSGQRRTGRLGLEIQAYALDEDGGVQDLWLRRLGFDLDEVGDVLARGGFRILGGLELPPGIYRLRVLVRESPDGRMSLSTTPLRVRPPGNASLLAMDPVLVERSGNWLALASLPESASSVAARVLALDPARRRPLVPAAQPSVLPGDELDLLVVASDPAPDEVRVRVVDGAGDVLGEAPLRSVPVAPAPGNPEGPNAVPAPADAAAVGSAAPSGSVGAVSRYMGRIATAGLRPGIYGLEVQASTAGGAVSDLRSVLFEVRADQ